MQHRQRQKSQPLRVCRLGAPVSNCWLLPDAEPGPLLIDTGFASLWRNIRKSMERQGVSPGDLAAVLLTHRHSDHAGNAARLQRRYSVEVLAHPEDGAVLGRRRPRPSLPLSPTITGGMCLMENLRPAPAVETGTLEHGAWWPAWK